LNVVHFQSIFLKNLEKARQKNPEVDERTIILELLPGEQLEVSDIEKAMEDPDIKPTAIHSAESTGGAAQLYFGPGFEDRLEMELDEYVSGHCCK